MPEWWPSRSLRAWHHDGDKTILEYEVIGGDDDGLRSLEPRSRAPGEDDSRSRRPHRMPRADSRWGPVAHGLVRWNGEGMEHFNMDKSSVPCDRVELLGGLPRHPLSLLQHGCDPRRAGGVAYSPLYEHPQTTASGTKLRGSIPIDDLLTGNRWMTLAGPQAGKESVRFYPGQPLLASGARGDVADQGSNCVLLSDLPTQRFWTPCGRRIRNAGASRSRPTEPDLPRRRWTAWSASGILRDPEWHALAGVALLPGFCPALRQLFSGRETASRQSRQLSDRSRKTGRWTVWDVSGKRPRVLVESGTPTSPCNRLRRVFLPRDG